MGALMTKRVDTSGFQKAIEPEDEDLIIELYEVHEMPSYQIALKFEINPAYLYEWLRRKKRTYFERGERCTLLS